jgi:hypothetical protein
MKLVSAKTILAQLLSVNALGPTPRGQTSPAHNCDSALAFRNAEITLLVVNKLRVIVERESRAIMLGRIGSVILVLCLLANVTLGCAMMTNAPSENVAMVTEETIAGHAMAGCDQETPVQGKTKAPHSGQPSPCKSFAHP